MIKCIVCAERSFDIQQAYTCLSCMQFLLNNGYKYNGETIEQYQQVVADILARNENLGFLAEITRTRQTQKQSVLDAIAKVGA